MFRAITLVIITTAASLILTAMPSVNHIDAVVAAAILGARAERVLRLCELPAFLGVQPLIGPSATHATQHCFIADRKFFHRSENLAESIPWE